MNYAERSRLQRAKRKEKQLRRMRSLEELVQRFSRPISDHAGLSDKTARGRLNPLWEHIAVLDLEFCRDPALVPGLTRWLIKDARKRLPGRLCFEIRESPPGDFGRSSDLAWYYRPGLSQTVVGKPIYDVAAGVYIRWRGRS